MLGENIMIPASQWTPRYPDGQIHLSGPDDFSEAVNSVEGGVGAILMVANVDVE